MRYPQSLVSSYAEEMHQRWYLLKTTMGALKKLHSLGTTHSCQRGYLFPLPTVWAIWDLPHFSQWWTTETTQNSEQEKGSFPGAFWESTKLFGLTAGAGDRMKVQRATAFPYS